MQCSYEPPKGWKRNERLPTVHLPVSSNIDREGATGGSAAWRHAPDFGNPFQDPMLVAAAARHLGDGHRLHVVGGRAPWKRQLTLKELAVTPLGSAWSVWGHVHTLDTTPVDGRDHAALLDAAFGFMREQHAHALRWATLPTDTEFFETLTQWLSESGLEYRVTKTVQRPVLDADAADGADLLAERIGGKKSREFRRCRRRLEELGELKLVVTDGPHDASAWLPAFFAIERSGWKGDDRTALACIPPERAWFEEVAGAAAAEGRILVYSLVLDGNPIAMTVNFRSGRRIWCFKTAYHDDFARFAPGALLEYEATLAALADPSIGWMDACTVDDGGLMGWLWSDRRPVADLLISTRRSANPLVRTAAMGWRGYLAAKRRGSTFAKHFGNRGPGKP